MESGERAQVLPLATWRSWELSGPGGGIAEVQEGTRREWHPQQTRLGGAGLMAAVQGVLGSEVCCPVIDQYGECPHLEMSDLCRGCLPGREVMVVRRPWVGWIIPGGV